MKKATLKDVAQLADVHVATASRALDPDKSSLVTSATRRRVLAAADQLGYRGNALARGLRTGRSGIVAVIAADVGNPFLPPLLHGIEREIAVGGYMLLIAETHDRRENLVRITDHLAARRVDAIILCSVHLDDGPLVTELERVLPVVLAVRSLRDPDHLAVVHDDTLGGRLAADHLIDLGHAQVAQLQGPNYASSFVGRTAGFRAVVAEREVIDCTIDIRASEPTQAEGRRLMNQLLDYVPRSDWPTGVFAHNDMMAIGAIEALAGRGLNCPADISVVGYNDSPLTEHVSPPLTTVRLPSFELGRRAAQLALAKIDGRQGTSSALPPELVIRASTRRRRRSAGRTAKPVSA